jgi:hypothetical protein
VFSSLAAFLIRAVGDTVLYQHSFIASLVVFFSGSLCLALMGGAVGSGGVRGWRLDEVTMLNPSMATCLNVRV